MALAFLIMSIGLFVILCILVIIKIFMAIDGRDYNYDYFYEYIFDKENKNANMHSRRRL